MPDREGNSQAPKRKTSRMSSCICAKYSTLFSVIYFVDFNFCDLNYLHALTSLKSKPLIDFLLISAPHL